jgi:hypothetical protein
MARASPLTILTTTHASVCLERRLEAAQREIEALKAARDAAMKIAVWGGRLRK